MRKLEMLIETLKPCDKITILGHDSIDVDAFISGILLSKLLNFLKINNEFVILEEVTENESYRIVEHLFKIDMKEYYSEKEAESRNLFLEDHYKTNHKGNVVACLDHHPTQDVVEYPFNHSRISCSTSYLVYELMKEARYQISKEEVRMILVSMMIDTVSFRSGKTVKEEVVCAKKLAEQYDLDYEELEKYCLCLTPINDISVEEIISNGYKYYNYNGKKVKSSYIQIYGMVEEDKIANWVQNISKKVKEESIAMWVFIIFECKEDITYEYRIKENSFEEVVTKGILSRGTNIMPKIEEIFLKK